MLYSFFVHLRSNSAFMHGHGTRLSYKLPCSKIVLCVLVDTRIAERGEKKVPLAAAFVIGQRLRRRVRTAAASGQPRPDAAADIRPDAGAYAAPLLSIYVPRDP